MTVPWRNSMIRIAALAGILAALPTVHVQAQDALPTVTYKVLPLALATEAAQAALASCKTQGYNVSVAVTDRLGLTQVLLVGDNASPTGRTLAPRKAYTSSLRRISTGELNQRVSQPGAFNPLQFDTNLTIERGAIPINVGNE